MVEMNLFVEAEKRDQWSGRVMVWCLEREDYGC